MSDFNRYMTTQEIIKKRRKNEEIRKARTGFIIIMGIIMAILLVQDAFADESEGSDYEFISPSCDNCFRYMETGKRVWVGHVGVYLNASGSPFSRTRVEASLKRAINTTKTYIEIDLSYEGATQQAPASTYEPSRQNTIITGFSDVSLLGYAYLWWDWGYPGVLNHGQIELNPSISEGCLDGIVLHELLHNLYIQHSEIRHSVMYSTPYNSCKYQKTLRLDDIKALQSLYPATPNRQGVITSFDGTEACTYQPVAIYEDVTAQGLTLCGIITSASTED